MDPLLRRAARVGAACAGITGAVAGLIIGLRVDPAAAWFVIIKLGVSAAIAGGIAGLMIGSIFLAFRHAVRH